jgi:hypothetical protein
MSRREGGWTSVGFWGGEGYVGLGFGACGT